jgi:hypothetical protein
MLQTQVDHQFGVGDRAILKLRPGRKFAYTGWKDGDLVIIDAVNFRINADGSTVVFYAVTHTPGGGHVHVGANEVVPLLDRPTPPQKFLIYGGAYIALLEKALDGGPFARAIRNATRAGNDACGYEIVPRNAEDAALIAQAVRDVMVR